MARKVFGMRNVIGTIPVRSDAYDYSTVREYCTHTSTEYGTVLV